jgi:apolipoprotein N-acyltransferase
VETIIPREAEAARDAREIGARRSFGLLASWRADVVSLAMGASFPLAFAPYGYGLIAYPALAVFFLACLNASAIRAAWRGWLFGVGQFTVGCGWVYTGLQYGGGVPAGLPLLLTVFLVGVLALYPALAALASASLYARRPHTMLLVALPLTWALAEYARSTLWTGFPWLLAGYSQIDTPLAGYAPLLGVFGTGMIAALVGGLLGSLLLRRQNYVARLVGIAGLFLFGSLVLQISWTEPQGDPIRVSLLQGNAVQDEKWSNHSRTEQMNWYQAQTREHWNSDLIVWPETSIADTPANVEFLLANLRARSIRDAKDVIVGVVEGDFAKGGYFNSLVNLRGGTYHKRRLVPLAEYFPWPNAPAWLASVLRLPMSDARPGEDDQPLLEGAGHKLGASICYEISYSDEVRRALPAAAVLVNSGNDAAFRQTNQPYQHHEIARFRALETGRYLIRAVNTGISAVIGSKGEVVAGARAGEETVVTAKVQPLSGSTPYVWLGDTPLVVLGLGFLVLAGVVHRRRNLASSKTRAPTA